MSENSAPSDAEKVKVVPAVAGLDEAKTELGHRTSESCIDREPQVKQSEEKGKEKVSPEKVLDEMMICNPQLCRHKDKERTKTYAITKVDPFLYQVDRFSDESDDNAEEK